MAQNTTKHLRAHSFSPRGGEATTDMAKVLADGRSLKEAPLLSMGFTAHGPLRFDAQNALEKMLAAVDLALLRIVRERQLPLSVRRIRPVRAVPLE